MKCPHCNKSISLLSPALTASNKAGPRKCPHCQNIFSMKINIPIVIGVIVPLYLVLIFTSVPMIYQSLIMFVTFLALAIGTLKLKKE
ncbi:MAG: hypothetical protein WCH44_19160 [Betaproteobacteria bacterium]